MTQSNTQSGPIARTASEALPANRLVGIINSSGLPKAALPDTKTDETPFVTAYIDLAEGDRMFTVLRGVDPTRPETIKIGAKVKVEFEAASADVHIPFWRVV